MLLLYSLDKEMKWTPLHMNARGQGHLLAFAKVTLFINILSIFPKNTIRLNDSYILYDSNL